MLGPIGSNLMNILKVLTPSEIENYSKEGVIGEARRVGKTAFALAAGAEGMVDSHSTANEENQKFNSYHDKETVEEKAKILPFDKNQKNEKKEQEDPYAGFPEEDDKQNSEEIEKEEIAKSLKLDSSLITDKGSSDLESVGILSRNKIEKIESELKKKKEAQEDSATIFLLKQRKRLLSSKTKLIEQEAIENYKRSVGETKYVKNFDPEEDDVKEESVSKGVLINKKTY